MHVHAFSKPIFTHPLPATLHHLKKKKGQKQGRVGETSSFRFCPFNVACKRLFCLRGYYNCESDIGKGTHASPTSALINWRQATTFLFPLLFALEFQPPQRNTTPTALSSYPTHPTPPPSFLRKHESTLHPPLLQSALEASSGSTVQGNPAFTCGQHTKKQFQASGEGCMEWKLTSTFIKVLTYIYIYTQR